MKLSDIIIEDTRAAESDEILRQLLALNDPVAPYFASRRQQISNPDVAMRRAENDYRLARTRDEKNKAMQQARKKAGATAPAAPVKPEPVSATPVSRTQPVRTAPGRSDRFYGNQHTGSLGKGYQPGELGQLMGIRPNSAIGKAIAGAKKITKPVGDLKRAFQIGRDFASRKR